MIRNLKKNKTTTRYKNNKIDSFKNLKDDLVLLKSLEQIKNSPLEIERYKIIRKKLSVELVNVVCSIKINKQINLEKFSQAIANKYYFKYQKKIFSALIFYYSWAANPYTQIVESKKFQKVRSIIKSISFTMLFFESGSVVAVGLKTYEPLVQEFIKEYLKRLLSEELYGNLEFKINANIVNSVYSISTFKKLNLDFISSGPDWKNYFYQTEIFPGLIRRCQRYKPTFVIYQSGEIILAGVTRPEILDHILRDFFLELDHKIDLLKD